MFYFVPIGKRIIFLKIRTVKISILRFQEKSRIEKSDATVPLNRSSPLRSCTLRDSARRCTRGWSPGCFPISATRSIECLFNSYLPDNVFRRTYSAKCFWEFQQKFPSKLSKKIYLKEKTSQDSNFQLCPILCNFATNRPFFRFCQASCFLIFWNCAFPIVANSSITEKSGLDDIHCSME